MKRSIAPWAIVVLKEIGDRSDYRNIAIIKIYQPDRQPAIF